MDLNLKFTFKIKLFILSNNFFLKILIGYRKVKVNFKVLEKKILRSKKDDKKFKTSGATNFINIENNISLGPTIMPYMSVTNVRGITFVGMQMQG